MYVLPAELHISTPFMASLTNLHFEIMFLLVPVLVMVLYILGIILWRSWQESALETITRAPLHNTYLEIF